MNVRHRIGCRKRLIAFLTVPALCAVFPLPGCSQNGGLRVQFDHISISDTTVYQNLPAGFPHPVLSLITVRNHDGLYIKGLADTSGWLKSTDLTPSGELVGTIWDSILEYHAGDSTVPDEINVKSMIPDFQVTEVRNVEGYGLSVALVMDYSFSMGSDKQVAEEAASVFVRQKNGQDRAAVIKFNGRVFIEPFTRDTTDLMSALDSVPDHHAGTAFYDALYLSMEECRNEPWRRAVMAFTDGRDNMSARTADEVIEYARRKDIPVFIIGLGNKIDSDVLRKIARKTGGIYKYSPGADGLASIYLSMYGLLGGYYVLAHTTTDPFYNGTWRRVDLTLKYDGMTGSGSGEYFVPFIPPDIALRTHLKSDSMTVSGPDTLYYARGGDTLECALTVTNVGQGPVGHIQLVNRPDCRLHSLDYSLSPDFCGGDSLVWNIGRLNESEAVQISYRCVVDTHLTPLGYTTLTSHSNVLCLNDGYPDNNVSRDSVFAIGPMPPSSMIQVLPRLVEPGEPVEVRVFLRSGTQQWDLEVLYEDGSCMESYGDDFIRSQSVIVDSWTTVQPHLSDTQMRTEKTSESVHVVLTTIGYWSEIHCDTASFSIQSGDDYYLAKNIFRPHLDGSLGIHFKLSSNREAAVTIYDISGAFVVNAADGSFQAGWNTVYWDGADRSGKKAGSGLYMAMLRSGDYHKALKFMIVR